jgi:hypothetical protein
MTSAGGARFEISIDRTTRTYRDQEERAREAAIYLKKPNPHSEMTLRHLQTGTVTLVKHLSSQ